MALQKDIELDNGVVCNYIKISQLSFYNDLNVAHVDFYLNADARSLGKKPVHSAQLDIELDEVANNSPANFAYIKLKAMPVFDGALDV